ncbi:DUF4145 domain-containing protein [Virgibacillus sp. DJP39]|uniref:DUF4145 domain-containing protein n=1 Tax=Virgibacillus sp. DJP39 TaxID=3409790 RepID=UPI003BB71180
MSKLFNGNTSKNPVFICPHCLEYYSHTWYFVHGPFGTDPGTTITEKDPDPFGFDNLSGIIQSNCNKCDKITYWLKSMQGDELQVYPMNFENISPPHKDMPEHIKKTYKEAGSVMHLSLRSSAALARLTLENLLAHLGYAKGKLYDRIKDLEDSHDISSVLKQKLHLVRKVGNTGAHTGSISFEEHPEIPKHLLTIINDIVDELITKPKTLEELKKFIDG